MSGLKDKEYLKTAIRVQAQDYLDKPIDLTLVGNAVAEASRSIVQRRQSLDESKRDGRVLKELSPLFRQAQALALFGLGPRVSLEPRFSVGPLRALILADQGSESAAGWKAAVLALVNGDAFGIPSLIAAPGPDGEVLLACDNVLGTDPALFDQATESLLGLVGKLKGSVVRLAVSPAVPVPEEMPGAWAEARVALSESFYRPALRILTARPPSGRILELDPQTLASWRRSMEAKDYPSVVRQLELLEQRSLSVRDADHARVRAVWLKALECLLEYVSAWGPPERNSRLDKLRRDFSTAPDLATVASLARDCFERLFVLTAGDLHVGDRIQRAQAYIESRFADPDLTVDAIAGYVGFSESYFCTVFKQSQDITVKDFVTRHRIERAKAYLWEKDPPTLADLALKVGFRDPNYFSTVFKRLTGTSPGAYRKKALG
jgi:two-component system response regulator YesN